MSTLVLYGKLAEVAGQSRVYLDVESIREMIHAISAMVPEVVELIKGSNWTIINGPLEGGCSILLDEIDVAPAAEVHLLPATEGGSGGGMMVLGAALIAASFFLPPAAAFIAPALMGAGAGMMAGGLAQMLVRNPKTSSSSSSSEDASSFIFGDSGGTTQQGKCVPVTYGIDVVDPITVSVSIAAEDYVGS